ncbi:RelA/SpoT family protein [Candidatus Peregrinibacteria bacterium]|nr:RelA/SpoT family protein [Candidatus Peregrinibacteria bacterium]
MILTYETPLCDYIFITMKYLTYINEIIKNVKDKIPNFSSGRLIKAYKFALNAHEGQKRKEGAPYIIHPIETTKILSNLRVDENTLIAALLHDVPEDTLYTIEDIEKNFGEHAAFLVNGVTKLSKVYYKHDMAKREIESLKKLLLHTSKDPRVIFIKLADRLHNMRTIKFVKQEKQARISRETLEIYVPIANLMGIQGIKNELEDLCFKNLYPQECKLFSDKIKKSEEGLTNITQSAIETISKDLKKHKIKAGVFPRKKSVFTIYKKIKSLRKTVDDVFDLVTLRIITNNIENCYKILGIIHSIFKPDPGRFKDYIAVPKINGYESLHTTVFCKDGVSIEIQIRTEKMNENSEMGLDLTKVKTIHPKLLNWMEQILELQKDEPDIDYFMKDLKYEIFSDRIRVFDMAGNAMHLPIGSCVIDFICATTPEKIDYAVGAEINGKNATLTSILERNNKVKIITSETIHHPKLEWLPYIKTNIARTKIREFFRNKSREEKIQMGKNLLEKAFNIAGLGFVENINFKDFKNALYEKANYTFDSISDMYAAVGDGTILPFDIIKLIYMKRSASKEEKKIESRILSINPPVININKKIRLYIEGADRTGFVEDVSNALRSLNISMVKIVGWTCHSEKKVKGYVTIDFVISDLDLLDEVVKKIQLIPGVDRVERRFIGLFTLFIAASIVMLAAWIIHPFIVNTIVSANIQNAPLVINLFIYGGLLVNFLLVVYVKKLSEMNFPGLRRGKIIWTTSGLILLFAISMIAAEVYYYKIKINLSFAIIMTALLVLYTIFVYIDYAKIKLPKK